MARTWYCGHVHRLKVSAAVPIDTGVVEEAVWKLRPGAGQPARSGGGCGPALARRSASFRDSGTRFFGRTRATRCRGGDGETADGQRSRYGRTAGNRRQVSVTGGVGVDSARARAEKGAPRKLKRLVCGGSVVCANLLRRDATARDGWEVAANPARYAVQCGKTTRSRAAIPSGWSCRITPHT